MKIGNTVLNPPNSVPLKKYTDISKRTNPNIVGFVHPKENIDSKKLSKYLEDIDKIENKFKKFEKIPKEINEISNKINENIDKLYIELKNIENIVNINTENYEEEMTNYGKAYNDHNSNLKSEIKENLKKAENIVNLQINDSNVLDGTFMVYFTTTKNTIALTITEDLHNTIEKVKNLKVENYEGNQELFDQAFNDIDNVKSKIKETKTNVIGNSTENYLRDLSNQKSLQLNELKSNQKTTSLVDIYI